MEDTFWNPSLYDESHSFITLYGEDLLSFLSPCPGEKILDAGCATGDLSDKIAKKGVEVLGIDSSEEMIERARKKYPHIDFKVGDIRKLPFQYFQEKFDGVFSNAMLHWVQEADTAIASIYHSLKPGGRFVAEMGGKNNVITIVHAIYKALEDFDFPEKKERNPWFFPSIGDYSARLEKAGFVVREMFYFDRPTQLDEGKIGLRNWLIMFGNIFFQDIPPSVVKKIFSFIEEHLQDQLFKEGSWWADYKRLRVRAIKPE